MKTITTKPVRVTRCTGWPNGLGFDCTVNGVRFQVTNDRAVGRLIALREGADKRITHSYRLVDRREAAWIEGNANVAKLVYSVWQDQPRYTWTRHDDEK